MNAARARELFEALVGRRTGIVRQVATVAPVDGDAALYHAGAQIANAHPYHGEHGGLGVGGCAPTPELALIAALCEGVERYAASSYGPTQTGLQPRRALGTDAALDPSALVPFTTAQRAEPGFPLVPVDDDTPLRWERGWNLTTGAPIWIPAFAVFLPYMLERDEAMVGLGLSTGLACGATLEEALARGLCEAVERDAMALTWIRGVAVPRLDPNDVVHTVGPYLPPRDEVMVYDLTTDVGLPVYMAVYRGVGPEGPLVSVGAACHVDARAALAKAAIEASQDRVYVRLLIERDPSWRPTATFDNVTDFSLHARLYSHDPRLAQRGFAFFDANRHTVTLPAPPLAAGLAPILAALNRVGMTAVAVELTPPWARDLGLHVVRVVVPELMPLHGNHTLRALGHPRLARWAQSLPAGVVGHDRPYWPYPHPMP